MESQISTYSNKNISFRILDSLAIELEIESNPYHIPLEDLFLMAARKNKKRSFLFVSKLLGKHLPVLPEESLNVGHLLANQYYQSLTGTKVVDKINKAEKHLPKVCIPAEINPIIIGFAETATALGQAFFSAFQNAYFFHTTREVIDDSEPIITFEEEHSHATSHRCYIPETEMMNKKEIILVDDELTTGKTALNIIRSIQQRYPRERYTVISILDWRSNEDKKKFTLLELELGIKIKCISLVKGKFSLAGSINEEETPLKNGPDDPIKLQIQKIHLDQNVHISSSPYLGGQLENTRYGAFSGRFGLSSNEGKKLEEEIQESASILKKFRTADKTICIGTGEFMYIPMKISSLMGDGVWFQSTTRSPIHIHNEKGYGARFGLSFPSPENPGIKQFLYNIAPEQYEEAFIFFEREVPDKWLKLFLQAIQSTKMKTIHIVFFQSEGGIKE